MLTLKEEKTKAAQGRKNKKGSKKGDMEEVRAVNKPGLVQNEILAAQCSDLVI